MARNTDTDHSDEGYPDDYTPPDLARPDPPTNDGSRMRDDRIPEHIQSEGVNDSTGNDVPVPFWKVNAVGVTRERLEEHGITRDEAGFLFAVTKAMNGTLDGYNLTDSMSEIKAKYDIDEEKLRGNGLLKRHTGVARRVYYSTTPAGQQACRVVKTHGFRVGDVGDDTPHRVGVELTRGYYESLPNVRRVEVSRRWNGAVIDLVVVDHDGNWVAIVEVEGGSVTADPDSDVTPASAGINDYDSIRKDYRLLAESAGESIWVVRNHEIAGTVLRALTSADDDIPVNLPTDIIRGVELGRIKMDELREKHIDPTGAEGIDEIVTFQQLRNRLR